MIRDSLIALFLLFVFQSVVNSFLLLFYKARPISKNCFVAFFQKLFLEHAWRSVLRICILKHNSCPYSFKCFETNQCFFWNCPFYCNKDFYLKSVNERHDV